MYCAQQQKLQGIQGNRKAWPSNERNISIEAVPVEDLMSDILDKDIKATVLKRFK